MKIKRGPPAAVDVEVGRRLRERRVAIGMSQERLASMLGVTYQQVQKYERGVNRIGSSRLAEMAKARAEGLAEAPAAFAHAAPAAADPPTATPPRELRELLAAFERIADPVLRRRIVDLVQAVADQG
jgi:transcriptional regulator with XRE-family HTH domain